MLNESLKLVRIYHQKSQTELAGILGISKSYLSEIENGKKKVTLELLEKYSETFDIPSSSLMMFSEQLESNTFSEKARVYMADKVVKMLGWLSSTQDAADAHKKAH